MRYTLLLLIVFCVQMFFSCNTKAQCYENYDIVGDSALLIQIEGSESFENLLFRNHYLDDYFGDIYLQITPGLIVKLFNPRYMDFIVIAYVACEKNNKCFKPSRLIFEFSDHSCFELKSYNLIFSTSILTYHFESRSFYLNSITFNCLMRNPIYKITLIDDNVNKKITVLPKKDELMKQAECISKFIPKETLVGHYSKVIDSLLHVKKYGNMGK